MIILSEQGRTATAASSSLRRAKTLTDPVVEQAFLTVPRELFVAPPTRPSRDWRRSTATTPSSPGGTPWAGRPAHISAKHHGRHPCWLLWVWVCGQTVDQLLLWPGPSGELRPNPTVRCW